MVGIDAHLDEALRMRGGQPVGPHQHRRVGIVDPGQPDGTLHTLQQVEVDTGGFADLARGDVGAVVAHQPARGQQHRSHHATHFFDGDALLEQPLDKLGTLLAGSALQTVEQTFDVSVGHMVKV